MQSITAVYNVNQRRPHHYIIIIVICSYNGSIEFRKTEQSDHVITQRTPS